MYIYYDSTECVFIYRNFINTGLQQPLYQVIKYT